MHSKVRKKFKVNASFYNLIFNNYIFWNILFRADENILDICSASAILVTPDKIVNQTNEEKESFAKEQVDHFSNDAEIIQHNKKASHHNSLIYIPRKGYGRYIKFYQINDVGSFLNFQYNVFDRYATPTQTNAPLSGGNIQINHGKALLRLAPFPTDQRTNLNGFGFNLQYNVLKRCPEGVTDNAIVYNGNIRILKCTVKEHFYYDAGYAIYNIYERDCDNRNFIKIQDGKVYVTLCTGFLEEI